MTVLYELVRGHVIDTTKWNGENPSFDQEYFVRNVAAVAGGVVWAIGWKLLYYVIHALSSAFFPRYKTLNSIQKVDWTSRYTAFT